MPVVLSPVATDCMVYLPLPQTAWFISRCHRLHGLSPVATDCMVYLPLPQTAWFISRYHRLHGAGGDGSGLAHSKTVILDT